MQGLVGGHPPWPPANKHDGNDPCRAMASTARRASPVPATPDHLREVEAKDAMAPPGVVEPPANAKAWHCKGLDKSSNDWGSSLHSPDLVSVRTAAMQRPDDAQLFIEQYGQ